MIDVSTNRIDALDIFRGIGIVLMIAYHFSWDLTHFGWADFQLFTDPFWLGARTFIVSIFLVSAGVSFALDNRRQIDPMRYLNRLSKIMAAAIAVSIGTATVFPDGFVFFGILHNLAVASLLIWLFRGLPYWGVAACGIAVIAIGNFVDNDIFNPRWLAWIGMASNGPFSVDYVPIFPWFGATLLGLALMQLLLGSPGMMKQLEDWRPDGRHWSTLRWMGRKTLLIYLIHQPILFGALWIVDQFTNS